MQSLGIANVMVRISNRIKNLSKETKRWNFDITAWHWPLIQNSSYLKPLLLESILSHENGFAVIYPSKRTYWIDNYIVKADKKSYGDNDPQRNKDSPYINWTAITKDNEKGIFKDITKDWPDYVLAQPDNYTVIDRLFGGPEWTDSVLPGEAKPNDIASLGKWVDFISHSVKSADASISSSGATDASTVVGEELSQAELEEQVMAESQAIYGLNYVNQRRVLDGLWWGIESSDFLTENMPFWVNFRRMQSPATKNHETAIVISIGPDHKTDYYDLYLSNNKKPQLIDYRGVDIQTTISPNSGQTGTAGAAVGATDGTVAGEQSVEPPRVEFDMELSKIFDEDQNIEVGFMTIAGRLIIFVNQTALVYTRMERSGRNAGNLKQAKIPAGKIRIWGTNIQANINVSPMTFVPLGVMAIPIPSLSEKNAEGGNIEFNGVKTDGVYAGSIAELPLEPNKPGRTYGVDCKVFNGPGGTVNPSGLGYHRQGKMIVASMDKAPIETSPNADAFLVIFEPENVKFQDKFTIESGGAPYFFRLKGGAEKIEPPPIDVSYFVTDVLSVKESSSADDYFHFKKNVSITLYNENGKYDYLKDSQKAVEVWWGWGGESKQTFTGVIVSASGSEVAGKETIDLQCEDHMHLLQNIPIINSPFYDGMLGNAAISDLAKRAGFQTIVSGWDNVNEYFLGSGYAFTKPRWRFPEDNMLFDCIMSIVKMYEAFVYFDEYGTFHISRLPGGLFSETSGESIKGRFTRDPSDPNVILDEKRADWSFDSTVNRISILTVDRDTRAGIIVGTSAGVDKLLYTKVMLIDQAALGDIESARLWMARLGDRVFYPTRKTSFKTVGNVSTLSPLDFITVDGLEYRLMSIQRTFNADSNDFVNEYNAEWLGGR